MKHIRKFLVMFILIYLSIPLASYILYLLYCFISWTHINLSGLMYIINPANTMLMRIYMIISFIIAIVVTYQNRDSKKYWW